MTNGGASLGVAMAALQCLLCCVENPCEAIACTHRDGDAFHVWAALARPNLAGTSLFVRRLRLHAGLYLRTFVLCTESGTVSSKLLRIVVRCLGVSTSVDDASCLVSTNLLTQSKRPTKRMESIGREKVSRNCSMYRKLSCFSFFSLSELSVRICQRENVFHANRNISSLPVLSRPM
jgi:hypothetical protein